MFSYLLPKITIVSGCLQVDNSSHCTFQGKNPTKIALCHVESTKKLILQHPRFLRVDKNDSTFYSFVLVHTSDIINLSILIQYGV